MPAGNESGARGAEALTACIPRPALAHNPGDAMPRIILGYTLGIATTLAARATWRAILGWALSRGD